MMAPSAIFRLTDDRQAEKMRMPATPAPCGRVYLTFDDGPVPEVTPWVLDMLDRYGVKATFFMVGENALRYPELVEEVRRRGHLVANHAHRHRPGYKSWTVTYVEDVRKAHLAIHGAIHESINGANSVATASVVRENIYKEQTDMAASRLFRPPHGYIRPLQLLALRLEGYEVVFFDIVSRDFDKTQTARQVAANVLDNMRDGSVIVFHDSIKAFPRLEEALPRVLEGLELRDKALELRESEVFGARRGERG